MKTLRRIHGSISGSWWKSRNVGPRAWVSKYLHSFLGFPTNCRSQPCAMSSPRSWFFLWWRPLVRTLMLIIIHVVWDCFPCTRFLHTVFAGKNRNFHLLLIAHRSRTVTNSRQNHCDFACPAYITKRRTSLSAITVVRFYYWSLPRAILTSISNVTCDIFYKIYDHPISVSVYTKR